MKVKSVNFRTYDSQDTKKVSFAVIMTRFQDKWVFVRHKERTTLEIPGGRRESGENILDTAKRELFEETGAIKFIIKPLDVYQVCFEGQDAASEGLLCYAEVNDFGALPNSEIAETFLMDECPGDLTYPQIQPHLFSRVVQKTQIISKTQKYEHIIWDWNGTLIDDVEVAVKSVNILLKENNLSCISVEKYKSVFGFPIKKYYEDLGFDLTIVDFDMLSERFHEEYNKNRLIHGRLFSDVVPHLDFFSKFKKQSILSAGAQWHLDTWVKYYDIHHYFDYVFGIDNLRASSKVNRGHELLKITESDKSKTILIGDTDHDVEVGVELGIDVLLIANGHQSYEKLSHIHNNVIETRFF